jgi:phosphatidylinositol-3-phosphatase
LIVLSNQGYNAAFGASSSAPYLSKTLPKLGELLPGYYAVSSGELANEIALISGQGPTPQTAINCPIYSAITPGTAGPEGQALGSGCVYPQPTLTLADQLTSAGKTWRAYIEGIQSGPGQPGTCQHPALGSSDPNQTASPGDPYLTWRNPFVYFQSLTGGSTCSKDDTGLGPLTTDLKSTSTTPSFAYIAPGACQDGSEEPCAPVRPAGLAATNGFLEKLVPEIELSPAYREGGLIAITSDQAPQSGPNADSSGCCLTFSSYPNLQSASAPPSTGTTAPAAAQTLPGGGKVGLLLISKYVKPDSVNAIGQYNHFSLLLSIEDLFGLKPLGYAGAKGLLPFDKSIYNAYK